MKPVKFDAILRVLEKNRSSVRKFLFPLIFFALVVVVGTLVTVYGGPAYLALVIAISGPVLAFWWDSHKENNNRKRGIQSILAQLHVELTQNIIDIQQKRERRRQGVRVDANILRSSAWLVATASPYFIYLRKRTVDNLISIYNRIDSANYFANIIFSLECNPTAHTLSGWQSKPTASDAIENAYHEYLKRCEVLTVEIPQVLGEISTDLFIDLENFKL